MALKPREVVGEELTKRDLEYIAYWENWIDGRLNAFRTGALKTKEARTFKLLLRDKYKTRLPSHIIPELLARYIDAGWHVDYQPVRYGKDYKAVLHYAVFIAPVPKLLTPAPAKPAKRRTREVSEGFVEPDPRSGYIYLLQAENGLYKIGRSKHPTFRISEITKAIAPFKIITLHTAYYPDCYAAESNLHRRYAQKRKRGEWFKLSADDIKSIIDDAYQPV